jgi:hypothetical protein
MTEQVQASPDSRPASALRFLTELIAWTATPWALAPHSIPLAIASVVVLIGVPSVFQTVPGFVTILIVLLQLVAAVVSSWLAWPLPVAVLVSLLALACLYTERARWRWLLSQR